MREVFILCEYPTLNGGERSMLSTLPGVRAAGLTPVVLCPSPGPLTEAVHAEAVEAVEFTVSPLGKRRPQHVLRAELAEILKRRRPALFHANSLAMGRLSGPVTAELGIPSLAHLRDIVRISPQAACDLNAHGRLLAVSTATRDFHVAGGLTPEKTFVLYNGVDLERFRPRTPTGFLHDELGLAQDAKLAAVVGQLGPRKGQDVLVQAAHALVQQFPELHFLLVGRRCSEKDETYAFEASLSAAAEGALNRRLHLLGQRREMHLLLAELTLLVHPARQEPLGRVLLEAAAAGLPIVATAVGGTAEIFPPESASAALIPPDNPKALAEAVEKLLRDESSRRQLAAAARRRTAEAFDLKIAVPNLLEHYHALLVQ